MTEIQNVGESKPQDPELMACQLEFKKICEEILVLRPEGLAITYWGFQSNLDPVAIQDRLRQSTFTGLLLADGDSLSAPNPGVHQPDINLYVGPDTLNRLSITAWLWEYNKIRIDPNGPEKPPFDIIKYPGEKDWTHQLDINLHYKDPIHTATQKISMQTGSLYSGELPSISRDVSSMSYAEQGYEGHNQVGGIVNNEEEVIMYLGLVRELFEARVPR